MLYDIWVAHRGEKIGWKLTPLFKRTTQRGDVNFDLYGEVNVFFSRMNDEDQQALFSVYQRLREVLHKPRIFTHHRHAMRELTKEFYDIMRYEDVLQWIKFYSEIPVPDNVEQEYVQVDEKPYTRMMTYVHEDYRKLQALVVLLRAMIPVWGDILAQEGKSIDTDWKETNLFKFLGSSALMNCEPMEKLRFYTNNLYQTIYAKDKDLNDSGIFAGMSSHDMPVWILGYVVVRKIAVGVVGASEDRKTNLISSVYNIVDSKLKNNTQNWSGLVKMKESFDDAGDDDNKLSVFERNRKRPPLADGEITMSEVVASDISMARASKFPWLPVSLFKESMRTVMALKNVDIQPVQIALAEVALQDWLTPNELGRFDVPLLMGNLALAQALAWHRGHHAIAALLTARHEPPTSTNSGRLGNTEQAKLNELFPYHHRSISKQKRELQKTTNPAIRTIDLAFKDIGQYDWYTTIPDSWLNSSPEPIFGGRLVAISDLRLKLAEYVIAFQEGYVS